MAEYENALIKSLREQTDGKDESQFEGNASLVSYKTNFPQLDYYLGYGVI